MAGLRSRSLLSIIYDNLLSRGQLALVLIHVKSKYQSIYCCTVCHLVLISFSCIDIVRGPEAIQQKEKHNPNRPKINKGHRHFLQPTFREAIYHSFRRNLPVRSHFTSSIAFTPQTHNASRQTSLISWLFSPIAGCAYAPGQHCCFIVWFLDGQHSATGYRGFWKFV